MKFNPSFASIIIFDLGHFLLINITVLRILFLLTFTLIKLTSLNLRIIFPSLF